MENIMIRKALPTDSGILVSFQLEMARETENLLLEAPVLEKGVEAVILFPERGQYYVAEHENAVIASLMITIEWSDWRNGELWWIQSVFVKPAYRGKGIFKTMYAHLVDLAMANPSVKGLRLYVDNRNATACRVYERLGMEGGHYRVFEWMKNAAR